MDLRDWLIIIGAVIIVGILVDGFRRMRLANKDSLKMSRDMGGDISTGDPLEEDYNPELPSGGARVVSPATDETTSRSEVDKLESQVNFELPLIDENQETSDEAPLVADARSRIELESIEVKTAHAGKINKVAEIEVSSAGKDEGDKHALVIVINVHAVTNEGFAGTEVKKLLEACGLDHGDMSIFHRHEEDDLLSPIQFSVANAIEPGYFDPNTLDEISTPGVSFFMTLPGPKDYSKAFEYMLETAQCFARNLKGELKDENLSVMTPQTIEHCRSKIKDFERRQLSKARA
jgi:cell division protein ZipA